MTRTLTEEQKTALTMAIAQPGTVEILIDASQDDAQPYADEISQVFIDAGWQVVTMPLPNPWFATPSGLSFLTPGDLPINDRQGDVIQGLNSGDVEYSRLDAMLAEGTDVKLLVGRVGV